MVESWNLVRLGDVADVLVGYPFKSQYFNENNKGIRLLRGKNVTHRGLRWGSDTRWWESITPDVERYLLSENDIVIGMDGSLVGKNYALISNSDLPLLLVQRVACIRAKTGVDQKYLWFVIASEKFERYIDSIRTGTSIPHVSSKQILDYTISLPPLPVQKKIAAILSSLDDKIEINTRMNKVLEETARALFHRWFVEFEFPNDEGKPYKSSGGRMIASEMGEIPEGWSVGSLRDLVTFSYGKPLKENDRRGGPYPVFGSNGIVGWHNKWLVEGPGIIVGRKGNPGVVKWSSYNFYPIDTTFYVVPFSKDYGLHYLYSLLEKLQLSRLSADSAVPWLNRDAALKQQILIPQKHIVEKYEKIAESLNLQKKINDGESRSLSKSRDILLDHLLKPLDL